MIKKQFPIWHVMRTCSIAVLLLIYSSACNDKKAEVTESEPEAEPAEVARENTSVKEYIEFVNADNNKMSLDHAYTNEALNKLVDATREKAGEVGYDVEADLQQVKSYADQITNDPFETTHADNIRSAAGILTSALQNMQREKFPDLNSEAEEVRKACESINPEKLTLDQKDNVKSFFAEAADLLEEMN